MKSRFFFPILCFMLPGVVMAQSFTVKGKVVNDKGELIPNAYVIDIDKVGFTPTQNGLFEIQLTAKDIVAFAAPNMPSKKISFTAGSSDYTVVLNDRESNKEAFQTVEIMPQFPGGVDEMIKFLSMNIHYPVEAQEQEIQGMVILSFVVDKDGTVKDVAIVRTPHESLSKESIRVVYKMPKWKPGLQKGEAVPVKFTLPIRFSLKGKIISSKATYTSNNLDSLLQYINQNKIKPAAYFLNNEQLSSLDSLKQQLTEKYNIKIITTEYGNPIKITQKVFIDTYSYRKALNTAINEGLYIVNGEEKSAEQGKLITRNRPTRTNIIVGKEAIDKYGEKGRKGVVVVTLIAPKQ